MAAVCFLVEECTFVVGSPSETLRASVNSIVLLDKYYSLFTSLDGTIEGFAKWATASAEMPKKRR